MNKLHRVLLMMSLFIVGSSQCLSVGRMIGKIGKATFIFIADVHHDGLMAVMAAKHRKTMKELITLLLAKKTPVFFHLEYRGNEKEVRSFMLKDYCINVPILHALNNGMKTENITYVPFDVRGEYYFPLGLYNDLSVLASEEQEKLLSSCLALIVKQVDEEVYPFSIRSGIKTIFQDCCNTVIAERLRSLYIEKQEKNLLAAFQSALDIVDKAAISSDVKPAIKEVLESRYTIMSDRIKQMLAKPNAQSLELVNNCVYFECLPVDATLICNVIESLHREGDEEKVVLAQGGVAHIGMLIEALRKLNMIPADADTVGLCSDMGKIDTYLKDPFCEHDDILALMRAPEKLFAHPFFVMPAQSEQSNPQGFSEQQQYQAVSLNTDVDSQK